MPARTIPTGGVIRNSWEAPGEVVVKKKEKWKKRLPRATLSLKILKKGKKKQVQCLTIAIVFELIYL